MKRKLILLAGTFLVVLAVVITYELFVPNIVYRTTADDDAGVNVELIPGKGGGVVGPESTYGHGLKIIETDTSRPGTPKKRIYEVKYWEKTDQGVYHLEMPKVTLFQKDGQEITITSSPINTNNTPFSTSSTSSQNLSRCSLVVSLMASCRP